MALLGAVALVSMAQITRGGGQSGSFLQPCLVVHNDAAVNLTVTVSTPTPPSGQFVYICGIDVQVANDSTGAVTQANVKFTSVNLNNWTYEYSAANAANTQGIDKAFIFGFPVRAQGADSPVTITSPAINAHAAYSVNLYYTFGP